MLKGTVRLSGGATGESDFMKRLPPPKEGATLTASYYILVGLVGVGVGPGNEGEEEEQRRVFADRDQSEAVAAELYPPLAATGEIHKDASLAPEAGTAALAAIRGDYHLIDARKWLELTESEPAVKKLLEVVGDGGRLA